MNWWQTFVDSFETKGAQILLLWFTDLLFVWLLIHYENVVNPAVMNTITGLVGGVNGAFLGAMGARQSNGNGSPKPDKLTASLVPANGPLGEKK
jgi:hypothetical protein